MQRLKTTLKHLLKRDKPMGAIARSPITWRCSSISRGNHRYKLYITAKTIGHGYRLYAQQSSSEGPMPTQISFEKNDAVEFIGKPKEMGNLKETYEEDFQVTTHYYSSFAIFIQEVQVKANKYPTILKGTVHYMLCSDSQCYKPATSKFQIELR